MYTVKKLTQYCPICKHRHEVSLVKRIEIHEVEGLKVPHYRTYLECEKTNNLFLTKQMNVLNILAMQDAFKVYYPGLLD